MSTITASLINLTISTPQNGHLSTQPKNPARCPLDPLAQQAKSVLIPITKRGISTLFIYQKYWHTGVYRLFICALKDSNTLNMCGEYEDIAQSTFDELGSPPHTWRIQFFRVNASGKFGITSTCVENTVNKSLYSAK